MAAESSAESENLLFEDSKAIGKLVLKSIELHKEFNASLSIDNPILEKDVLQDSANDSSKLTSP